MTPDRKNINPLNPSFQDKEHILPSLHKEGLGEGWGNLLEAKTNIKLNKEE